MINVMLNPDRDPALALLTVLEGIKESKINYSGRTRFGIRVWKPVVTMGSNLAMDLNMYSQISRLVHLK